MIEIPSNFWLDQINTPFPDVNLALIEPNGLIAIGGDLSTERLLNAYSNGIFPWYGKGEPILWYSPNPRMVITPDKFHLSKSLNKIIQSSRFSINLDSAFREVITQCRSVKRSGQLGTWIDDAMVKAYCDLHDAGYAHSYEVYEKDELVGGLYGVALGGVFFGESMFSRKRDASKVALVSLVEHLLKRKFILLDTQWTTPHLKQFGAIDITKSDYMKSLHEAIAMDVSFA